MSDGAEKKRLNLVVSGDVYTKLLAVQDHMNAATITEVLRRLILDRYEVIPYMRRR